MELSLVISFICFLSAVHSGESLQCYSCSTKNDPTCMQGDKLDSFKTECSSKTFDDSKKSLNSALQLGSDISSKLGLNFGKASNIDVDLVCQKVDFEENDQKYTLRSCFISKKDPENMCDIIKKQMHSQTVKISHCSQCTEDLCNSSSETAPAIFTTFIVLAAAMFRYQ